jgi:hypothetical protein
MLSSSQRDLIDKESVVSNERFRALQQKLRALLRLPEVELGLAAIEGDRVLLLNFGCRFEHSCIFADSTHRRLSDFAGSIYERASLERRPLFIEDLEAYPTRTPTEEAMLAAGYRSVVVAPLLYQDAMIGSLKLVSPKPGALNVALTPHLLQILPLFAVAVRRSMDELSNRVQAVIKEKCTAIHPWSSGASTKAVMQQPRAVESTKPARTGEMEPIVFRDVYPLCLPTSAAHRPTGPGPSRPISSPSSGWRATFSTLPSARAPCPSSTSCATRWRRTRTPPR